MPEKVASLICVPHTTVELELGPLDAGSNPWLNGWRAPVREEATSVGPFEIEGALPPGLEGRLLWLGANPVRVDDPDTYRPADGDAMLHLLEVRDGAIVKMASRFVVTRHLVEILGARAPEGPLAAAGPVASGSLVHLARRLLCLDGLGLGYRVTSDLATACVEDFDASLSSPMGLSVVVDPRDGSARFLGIDHFGPPWLRLHHLEASGIVTSSEIIELDAFSAEPALGTTQTQSLIFESSLRSPVLRGEDDVLGPLRFEPEAPTRVGVLAHGMPGASISWARSEPGHVHSVAALSDTPLGARAVVLRSTPERVGDPDWWPSHAGYLEAIDVNTLGRSCIIERLDDLVLDAVSGDATLPLASRRFLYGVTADRSGTKGAMLVKYDLVTGHTERRVVAEHEVVDAPLFVRDPEGRSDEEGWVVVPTFDRSSEASTLVILDATRFSAQREASIRLPQRLPVGMSGLHLRPSTYR